MRVTLEVVIMYQHIKLVKVRNLKPGDVLLVSRSCFNGCTTAEIVQEVDIRNTPDTGEVYVKTDCGTYNLYDEILVPVVVETGEFPRKGIQSCVLI